MIVNIDNLKKNLQKTLKNLSIDNYIQYKYIVLHANINNFFMY